MFFALGSRPRLHLVFATRLPLLVLRRLKFLFFRHGTSARRESRYRFSGGAFACVQLSSRRPSATVQSVGSPPASRVSTTVASMLTDGSRA
jgi:hypothetical protein